MPPLPESRESHAHAYEPQKFPPARRAHADPDEASARPSDMAPTANHLSRPEPRSLPSSIARKRLAPDRRLRQIGRETSAANNPRPASLPSRARVAGSRTGPAVAANTTPEVPIVALTAPGRTIPMRTAPAA